MASNETAKPQNPQFIQQGNVPPGTFHPQSPFSVPQPYPIIQPYNVTANRRPVWMRFLRAFAIAALVWFLCAIFLRSFLSMVHYRPWLPRPGSYPIPPYVTLEHCVSYGDWSNEPAHQPSYGFPLTAATTMDLPLSAESLLILSRGSRSAGSVEIVTSSQQAQDAATVEVVVSYYREDVRDQAKVCRIHAEDGGIGVGIFTPEGPYWYPGRENVLHFATKVILPESSSESSPLLIKKFETDVVNTLHRLGDLNKVLFQSLQIGGSNGRIDVESLQADDSVIKTSNAGIQGVFNTSTALSLVTSNGRVDVDVGLSSVDGSKPKLGVVTSNAAVASRISLISDVGTGGTFHTVLSTSNGRLDVDFPAAPPDSILTLNGKTSNARAVVSLNPAYEGSFLLQTSNAKPQINQDKSVTDPSGRNRNRVLKVRGRGPFVSGDVYWDGAAGQDDLKPEGSVALRSSNAQIELDL